MKQLSKSAFAFFLIGFLTACGGNSGLSSPTPATNGEFVFKGNHFKIGSAAEKTRAIQRRTGPVVVWPAHGALFAADPSLNGVMVYDETRTGQNVLPYGILSGPNTGLNGPVALTTGYDLPCSTTSKNACTLYLWVSNAGNETITYYTLPLANWNQAPTGTISWNGSTNCTGSYPPPPGSSAPLQFPYGIVDLTLGNNLHPGQIIQTSEAPTSSGYWINSWTANDNGPSQCYQATTNPNYDTPSGPSITPQSSIWEIFNANHDTVTGTKYNGQGSWSYMNSWSPGPGACTEGTAADAVGNVWVTTNAGCTYVKPTDALWTCTAILINGNRCVNHPACTNPRAKLDFPDFPGLSPTTSRLYVPNQNNGTVTAYTVAGPRATCRPRTIYVNLETPTGVALQN
ncbi:MAG TPA: hypothetical protein VGK84_06855 [Candidatus Tumulicola sp.]|jgi:hypothetical protein